MTARKMRFETLYNRLRASDDFATVNEQESMTQQADAQDADINVIMARYGITGQLPAVVEEGIYGDFTNVTSYGDALNKVRAADEAFQNLPAKIRDKFGNDPGKFVEFATDEKNFDEMVKLGLANAKEEVIIPTAPNSAPKE